jgi:hypothetical protein
MNDATVESGPERSNNGWFRRGDGDQRINRKGRPVGARLAARRARDGEPLSGRLKTLFVPAEDLRQCLTSSAHRWIENLFPNNSCDLTCPDVVAAVWDHQRNGLVLTIHSIHFELIQPGAPIPEMQAKYHEYQEPNRCVRVRRVYVSVPSPSPLTPQTNWAADL